MHRRLLGTVLVLVSALAASMSGLAVASPSLNNTTSGTCVVCHPIDANVVVSASFLGCSGTYALYTGTVTNPYGSAGYGLFRTADNLKFRSGYGTLTSFYIAPNTGFSFQGVSANSATLASGANTVEFTTPNCVAQCTDADGDQYNLAGAGCGLVDCNDGNAGINPSAAEIRLDGIDQNCNGYDLTITITKAQWSRTRKRLTVEATSSYNASAALQLNGYSAMTYNSTTMAWSKIVNISANPGTVTVSGPEGSWSSSVTTVK
jgi:hypothetical protein